MRKRKLNKIIFLVLPVLLLSCNQTTEEHYTKSIELAKEKEHKAAIEELDKVIEMKPDFAQAYLDRGNYRMANQDYSEAEGDTNYLNKIFELEIKDFTKAIELDPNLKIEALRGRAFAFYNLQNYKNASGDYSAILKEDSTKKDMVRMLAWCHIKLADTLSAKILLDRMIEVEPDNAENYYNRAFQRLMAFKDKTGACEDLEKAATLYDPEEYYTIFTLNEQIEKLMGINCPKK
ncbi:MAG: hypothetical protein V1720_07065 [bacterium]